MMRYFCVRLSFSFSPSIEMGEENCILVSFSLLSRKLKIERSLYSGGLIFTSRLLIKLPNFVYGCVLAFSPNQ